VNTPAPGVERGSSFYLGFLALSKPKRAALSAVYAYARLIDDIVDAGILTKDEARGRLDFWRAEIGRLYAGAPTHEISRALAPHISAYICASAFAAIVIRPRKKYANSRVCLGMPFNSPTSSGMSGRIWKWTASICRFRI
jgi:phytoene/squalene synthetase